MLAFCVLADRPNVADGDIVWLTTQRPRGILDEIAGDIGFPSYSAYLQSDRWRARRQQYADKHPPQCFVCGGDHGISLHHLRYDRLGREDDADFVWLCGDHHEEVHQEVRAHTYFLSDAHVHLRRKFKRKQRYLKGKRRKAMADQKRDQKTGRFLRTPKKPSSNKASQKRKQFNRPARKRKSPWDL